MAEYKQFETNKGNVRYHKDGKFVKKEEVSDAVKEKLADSGVESVGTNENDEIVTVENAQQEDSATEDDGSGDEDEQKVRMVEDTEDVDDDVSDDEEETTPEPQQQAQEPVQPTATSVPQSDYGFGFPRKNGKTLCVFTGKPFTHSRYVAGYIVPLSKEAYDTKTIDQILDKLRKLKKI